MLAVGLALAGGARAGAHLVGPGAKAARVQARFDVPDGWGTTEPVGSDDVAADWVEDGEVILARSVGADGKSSARVGGQLTTASALGDLSARLIEIHGQHGSLRLLDPSTQTAFLDRYAGAQHGAAVAAELLAGEGGIAEVSASVVRALDSITELDADAAGLAARARALAAETSELGRDLRGYREGLALDPARLAWIRDRIGELKTLQ